MLLTREAETIETSGLGAGNHFTIAASPKAFEILSSNLYQNKVLAVIREITCNAADAHRLVGKPLTDIQVHLPTFDEFYFSVRDFGPGLSQADVMELYTTYFRSTKDQSNDLIGGFGLGSKSPFAVADQFTVTSWHGGKESVYVCYKEGGLPRVNLLRSDPSTEPTGLEVRVATDSVSRWQAEASLFFRWWPELPACNRSLHPEAGFLDPANILLQSSDTLDNGLPAWAILKHGGTTVYMGLVPYRLDLDQLKGLPPDIQTLLRYTNLFLNVPVGRVEISPSREALSYDQPTIDFLTKAVTFVAKRMMADFIAKVQACPTLYDARLLVYGDTLSHADRCGVIGAARLMAGSGTLTWRGAGSIGKRIEKIHTHANKTVFGDTATVHFLSKGYRNKTLSRTKLEDGIVHYKAKYSDDHEQYVVWTEQISPKLTRKLIHHTIVDFTHPTVRDKTIAFHIYSGMPFDDLVKHFDNNGLPTPINGDELEDPPKAAPAPRTSTKTQGYSVSYDAGRGEFEYDASPTELDLKGGGVCIPFFNGQPNSFATTKMYSKLRLLGQLPPCRVMGLTKHRLSTKAMQDRLAANGWQILDDAWLAANTDIRALANLYEATAVQAYITDRFWGSERINFLGYILSRHHAKATLKGTFGFCTLLQTYINKHNISISSRSDYPRFPVADEILAKVYSAAQCQTIMAGKQAIRLLSDAWQSFLDEHPMLQYVNIFNVPTDTLVEYINR